MKRFSDLEKTVIVVWIILGGIIGAFFAAAVMRQKPAIPGLIGAVFGAAIAYAYFRNPRKRRHGRPVDKSKWMGDRFSDIVMKKIFECTMSGKNRPWKKNSKRKVKPNWLKLNMMETDPYHMMSSRLCGRSPQQDYGNHYRLAQKCWLNSVHCGRSSL